MTDPTIPSNAFEVLLHATGRRLTGKQYTNEHGQTVKEFRDMNTTNPPLPDYLDVPAAEIQDRALPGAAAWMSGIINEPHPQMMNSWNPQACIARWAGEDAERWNAFNLSLHFQVEINEHLFADYPVHVEDTARVCTATPAQLYRALVNAGWDEWRDKYNKQREAAEVKE